MRLTYAAQVAQKYHTEHHEILVRPDLANLVERGRRNNQQWLWSLLMLEMWLQQTGQPGAPAVAV